MLKPHTPPPLLQAGGSASASGRRTPTLTSPYPPPSLLQPPTVCVRLDKKTPSQSLAAGRLLGYSADGQPGLFDSTNEDGDVSWFDIPEGAGADPAYAHGGRNGYDDLPMREYLVELK